MKFDVSKIDNLKQREEAFDLLTTLNAVHDALLNAEDNAGITDEAFAAVRAKYEAALKAYSEYPLSMYTNYRDDPIRCALSGVPLADGDELLEDAVTGELVLRCLVLDHPRAETDENVEEAA